MGTDNDLQAMLTSPELFRENLRIDSDAGPIPFGAVMDQWQRDDFAAMDEAWKAVAGCHRVEPAHRRCWLERPRGHAKTHDIAATALWVLFASRRAVSGIVAAADADQARLLRDSVDRLLRLNDWMTQHVSPGKNEPAVRLLEAQRGAVVNNITGSRLEIIASDARSSYGLLCDFIIADEVVHWKNRDLFDSLLSAAAKRRHCIFQIITNSGFQDSWQWQIREAIRTDPRWHFSRLDGPQASWIDAETLAEQEKLLPRVAFERLWLNQWSSGGGDAIEPELIDAAITQAGPTHTSAPGWVYFGGLDLGVRHDATAFCIVGKHIGWSEPKPAKKARWLNTAQRAMIDLGFVDEPKPDETEYIEHAGSGRLKLCECRVWKPTGGLKVNLDDVERAVIDAHARFNLTAAEIDLWQSEQMLAHLQRAGVPVEGLQFSGGSLQAMASAVLDAFGRRNIDLFPHEDLIADVRNLRIKESLFGYRLESPRGGQTGTRHGDTATALSLALHASRRFNAAPSAQLVGELLTYA